jgi:hypothetical protein
LTIIHPHVNSVFQLCSIHELKSRCGRS